ncbi:MAG: hypothetical protein ABIJ21_06400 [Nanoarchaeota archaeon]
MITRKDIEVLAIGDINNDRDRIDPSLMNQFLRLPWQVYSTRELLAKNWVPPNLKESRFVLSRNNPFFEHACARLFLAMHEEKPVGRIAAIVDHAHNDIHHEHTGFFGFYESFCDPHVPQILFPVVEDWLREQGMSIVRGPLNPSVNDECGLLIDGFHLPPTMMMPYNPSYYVNQIEEQGFAIAKTLCSYLLTPDVISSNTKVRRLTEIPRKKGLMARVLCLDDLAGELAKVKEIYNDAWSPNYGFVPMTDKEIDSMAKRLADVIDPNLIVFVEKEQDGKAPEPIAFLLGVPNYNVALKHMDGKDGFFEKLKFIYYGGFPANLYHGRLRKIYSGKINAYRVMVMGVKKEHQKGASTAMMLQLFQKNLKPGSSVDMSWTLEDNIDINRTIEGLGGIVYKLHRIYEKAI